MGDSSPGTDPPGTDPENCRGCALGEAAAAAAAACGGGGPGAGVWGARLHTNTLHASPTVTSVSDWNAAPGVKCGCVDGERMWGSGHVRMIVFGSRYRSSIITRAPWTGPGRCLISVARITAHCMRIVLVMNTHTVRRGQAPGAVP